jgi:hypothetical protein
VSRSAKSARCFISRDQLSTERRLMLDWCTNLLHDLASTLPGSFGGFRL